MRRVPILVRLTAAFAAAMLLVLVAAALFVYLRLRADLDDFIDAELRARADVAAAALASGSRIPDVAVDDPEEAFLQVLAPDGRTQRTIGGDGAAPVLSADEVRRAHDRDLALHRTVPGLEGGDTRLFATSATDARGHDVVLVVGRSLLDRDEALGSVVDSFAIGGALAVVLASLLGYGVARAGLAPVRAMTARARQISDTRDDVALPLPRAHDEIRQLGETLNAMLARLAESFDRERRFVADASHELRSPLAVLRTEIEGTLWTADLTPAARTALESALAECDRLARLTEDLLVLASVSDGHLPIRPERLDLHVVLEAVRLQFADAAVRDGRHLVVTTPPDLHPITADPTRLRQALTNLVANALLHGRGDVTLTVIEADGTIISVTDEGDGFSDDFAPMAFERFTQADRAHRGDGAGLGLAIVHAIVAAHHGRAKVSVGRPATVTFWLP
jgi:two-component system OmpR family sensor kinase